MQIAKEEKHDPGTHHTSIDKWTCSCPSYLTSRFLLCKHLVRQANISLNGKPSTDLRFFAKLLRRARHAPFYSIPGIHGPELEDEDRGSENNQQTNILVLGGNAQGLRTRSQEGSGRLRSEMENSRKETGKDSDTEGRSLGVGRQEPEKCHTMLPMTMVEDPDDNETRVRKLT